MTPSEDRARRLPAIYSNGWKVMIPTHQKKDGNWSGIWMITAIFMDEDEAKWDLGRREKSGMPVKLKGPVEFRSATE